MEKEFFDVFPNLKLNEKLEELMKGVVVTKVSCNPDKTLLRVYIRSTRWIHKRYILELEEQIQKQFFSGLVMSVTVIEKFCLSRQYTPQNFLEAYRSSMELELKNYNMLEYNLFKRSRITFPAEDTMYMVLPDSVIAREKSEILLEYLQKVFCERCGMNLKVKMEFEETEESRYRRNAVIQIRQEVENVLKNAKLDKEDEQASREQAAETKKEGQHQTTQKRKNTRRKRPSKRRIRRAISAVVSARTAIRMWFMEETSREMPLHWRVLPVRWVR
jgi:DNA polymerase-3 subunit alpha (Gram-positive type)